MKPKKWLGTIAGIVALGVGLTGCGGSTSNSTASTSTTSENGQVFVNGTDAPLASVVSFQVDITGMTVSDGVNAPISVLNGTQTVDFARLDGLHTLLDLNTIPAGTYTTVNMTFANPQIVFMNVTNPQTNPPTRPTITTLNTTSSPAASLTTSSVTTTLTSPLTVSADAVIGLAFDFDLKDSVAVDGSGQITGAVNPKVSIKAVTPADADAYIDDFVAGVTTTATNSFTVQGPHGHTFTVNVNDQTEWENGETFSSLTASSIVEVSGTLDKTSGAILADTVAIVSRENFWAGGLITFVNPATNAATDFDLYVRSVLPSGTGFSSEQISTVNLTGNENYFVYFWHNKFTNFLFNSSLLVPGQHVSIGGSLSNSTPTVKRVVLRNEGHNGTWVVGSTNVGANTFQLNSAGVAGVLFNGPVTVYCTPFTKFKGGLSGLASLTGSAALNVRVVGVVLKDPTSGQAVLVAHSVEQMSN